MEDAVASDAELIARVRAGDLAAHGALYARHREAALRVARASTGSAHAADDLVSAAFERVRATIARGAGPTEAYRAYLYTVIRRLAADDAARAAREDGVDDWSPFEGIASVGGADGDAEHELERRLIARAFGSLRERHQAVLWALDVEGLTPQQAAVHFGLSANATSALAVRARDALRDAYLQAHVSDSPRREACTPIRALLGAYRAGSLAAREAAKVDAHLDSCDECPIVLAQLEDVRRGLRVVILPLVLGGAAGALGWGLAPVDGAMAADASGSAMPRSTAGDPIAAPNATARPVTVAGSVRRALRRPLSIAAAGVVALGAIGGIVLIAAQQQGAEAESAAAVREGKGAGAPVAGREADPADPADLVATTDPDGTSPAEPGDLPAPGGSGGDPGAGDESGSPDTPADPDAPASDPDDSGPPPPAAPPPPPAPPVVPQLAAALAIESPGSLLTGGKAIGTVTVTAQNVGPVALGGTMTIALPSGVTYDSGGLRALLGLVGGLLTHGAIQACSPAATQVVCSVVGLVPGASTGVRIPVTAPGGTTGGTPSAWFTLG